MKLKPLYSSYYVMCRRISILLLIPVVIIVCIGSLVSYDPHDASCIYYSSTCTSFHNWYGALGAHLAAVWFYCFGYAAWLWIGVLLYGWYYMWARWSWEQEYDRILAMISVPWIGAVCAHMHSARMAGGLVGHTLAQWLWYCFEFPGAWICLYSLMLIGCVLVMRPPLAYCAQRVLYGFCYVMRSIMSKQQFWQPLWCAIHTVVRYAVALIRRVSYFFDGWRLMPHDQEWQLFDYSDVIGQDCALHTDPFWRDLLQPEIVHVEATVPAMPESVQVKLPEQLPHQLAQEILPAPYRLPSVSLFIGVEPGKKTDAFKEGLEQSARTLEEKLERFDVRGRVVAIKHGPVVTLYEYEPEIDSKLSKIIALEDDLALALQALSIRIIAPIPGRCVVGFEVSNAYRVTVVLSSIIRSREFTTYAGVLPLILGEDTIGNNVIVDLADMPHLLIAGSTGSGKSVALNAMLVTLLCKCTPDELRLILIDPKRLEFAVYADIAHLLFPIVTDPRTAPAILTWVVEEMERRYECIVQAGVRNSADYNKRVSSDQRLPRIVVIIDELADLMMTAGRDIENLITRIAQMARAAGIHLIVATQRPSVDVITGLIKANFPSRISFRVTSKVDSRIILDCGGADKLLGRGDMLFLDAGSAMLHRVHGAYVSDKEIQDLVQYIKAERAVRYLELPQFIDGDANHMSEADRQLYDNVLAYLNEIEEISISLLQRKFRIGYNRSARLIDLLEQQGRIMPSDGGKMRRVLR